MAKKKAIKKARNTRDDRAIENGVDVSLYGTDRGYYAMGSAFDQARDGIVLKEMQQAVSSRRATVAYRTDHVDRLKEDGVIDNRVSACAGYFRADVQLALASGYRQSALEVISGGGADKDVIRNWKAYSKVKAVIVRLGGYGSPRTRAVFAYLIEEKTISSSTGSSGQKRLKERDNLLDALNIIADYYYPLKKKR